MTCPSGLSSKRSSSGCPPRTSFAVVLSASCGAVPPPPTSSCSTIATASHRSLSSDRISLDTKESGSLSSVTKVSEPIKSSVQSSSTLKFHNLLGACDGFLILSSESDFWICNPATRKCAILPQPRVPSSSARVPRIYIAGFYQHQPSGEYRVLWFSRGCLRGYVLRFGSDKPRIISQPSVSSRLPEFWHQGEFDSCYGSQVNHRGSLHWLTGNYMETAVDIMVFDTVTETFR
uniref:F-box associated beta-propeller type 1 domain-containing protein n=1 Tax=Aegilops tauschii subsp. strangulata TaxID=200361 RepID=A0A453SSX0_AEGTS